MRLSNLDDLVIFGPGSEWFWVMAQFLALAFTGIAIIGQLRAQRSATINDQVVAWHQEFEGPGMNRAKLALMLAIQDRDPVAGLPQAEDEVADFFEMIGYLVSRGHVSARDFWNDARPLVAFYWGVLAPYVEHDRAARRDPRLYRWFEWLEHEMRKIDVRETGRIVAYDPATRSVEIRDRIAKLRSKVLRESEAWPREVAASRTRRRQAVSPAKRPAP